MQNQIRLIFIAASLLISSFIGPTLAQDMMKDKSKMAGDKSTSEQSQMNSKEKMNSKMARKGRKSKKSEKMKDGKMKDKTMEEKKP